MLVIKLISQFVVSFVGVVDETVVWIESEYEILGARVDGNVSDSVGRSDVDIEL